MNIPQINIVQTLPQIGIHTVPGEMNIHQPSSVIEVKNRPAEMHIQYHYAKMETDWTKAYDDMGLKSHAARLSEHKAKMHQEGLEAIGQIVREGDRLGNLAANEQHVFRNLAQERFFRDREVETNVGLVPKHMPEFHVEVRPPDITVQRQSPEVRNNGKSLDIQYKTGQVDVYLATKPSIDIIV